MKRFTTSAQKTLNMPVEDIISTLEKHFVENEKLEFASTKQVNILKAKMKDGSILAIAAFDKAKGKCLAMIDHENVPEDTSRSSLQKKWKNTLNMLFE